MTASDYLVGAAAVITAATPGYLAWIQQRKNHKLMNSRLDELVKLTAESSRAKGKLEGAAEEKVRQDGVNTP